MMKDLEIGFTAKEITAFGGVASLYTKCLTIATSKNPCHPLDHLNRVPIAARVLSN